MKTYIIAGFAGSGKSEFAVNLALSLNEGQDSRTTIADLDTINPYFRSREKTEQLRAAGIDIFGGALGNNTGQDVPHLDYGFVSRISAGERVIVDLAGGTGGTGGTGALASVYSRLQNYEFLAVLNLYRPETSTAAKILCFINKLNATSRVSLTGFVNNSHMLRETTPQHILDSQDVILSVCEATGLPLRYTMLSRPIYEQISTQISSDEVLIFNHLQLRESWQ
ncbi:MAG: hypothetical protein FWE20_05295 [Defluviitaleaceae bacterium]|nr:hypothetical protein [Defluviitaleaceae bacterium]